MEARERDVEEEGGGSVLLAGYAQSSQGRLGTQ